MFTSNSDQYVRNALDGHLDEEVVAAQWFRARGGFEGGGLARVFRNVFGGDHPGDRLGNMNVLALTPTRLVAFAGRTGWSGLTVREQIAEWPAAGAQVEHDAHEATLQRYDENGGTTVIAYDFDVLSLTIALPGSDRPLEIELPDDAESHRLLDGLAAARGLKAAA